MFNIGDKVKVYRIDESVQQCSFEEVDEYVGKCGIVTDHQRSKYGTMYEIIFNDDVPINGLFFCENELELVNDDDTVLELGDLFIYNEVDSDGYIKISIEDGKVNSEYVHVSELDNIIKFLENIKSIECKRMGK